MVAGWEKYVGVLDTGQKQVSKGYNPSTQLHTYRTVQEKDRTGATRQKHVYQLNSTGKMLMDFEGWSDRKSM